MCHSTVPDLTVGNSFPKTSANLGYMRQGFKTGIHKSLRPKALNPINPKPDNPKP